MSRNRCSTECECGFWKFQDVHVLPIADGLLMTEDEYFRAIDWADCPYRGNLGHGWQGYYRELEDFWLWRSPDGMGCSNRRDQPGPDWKRELIARYQSVPLADRLRWRKIECPVCRRLYAGWYVRQPHVVEPRVEEPKYALCDTSYYYAFNDEPSERDLENLIEWTPEEIVKALQAWRTRT